MDVRLSWLISLSLLGSAWGGFLYGQPCTERNTAYLSRSGWIIPDAETNCLDITDYPGLDSNWTIPQRLKAADTLYADHMHLSRFPVALLYTLPRLEMLDLSGNDLKRIPHNINKLTPRIGKLLLADNDIFIPRKRSLFKSDSIDMLMLSRNGISHIYPRTFAKMPKLRILYLDGNRLKYVGPEMFSGNGRLMYLHLGGNAIAEFPPRASLPPLLAYYITTDQKKGRFYNHERQGFKNCY